MQWGVIGLIVSALAGAAHAQPVATDKELFASYCLGSYEVMQSYMVSLTSAATTCPQWFSEASCQDLQRARREGVDQVQNEISRLRRYLIVRGVWNVRSDVPLLVGITAAFNQGRDDTRQCLAAPVTDTGPAKDNYPPCVHQSRCSDLSRIPF